MNREEIVGRVAKRTVTGKSLAIRGMSVHLKGATTTSKKGRKTRYLGFAALRIGRLRQRRTKIFRTHDIDPVFSTLEKQYITALKATKKGQ